MRSFVASFKPTLMRGGATARAPAPPPPRPSSGPPSLATHGMKLSIISAGCSGFLEAGYACSDRNLYNFDSRDESAVWDVAVGGDWVGNVASPVLLYNRWRYFYLNEYTCSSDLVVNSQGYGAIGYTAARLWRVVYTAPNTVRLQYASAPTYCLGYTKTCTSDPAPGMYECRDARVAVDWRVTFVRYPARRRRAGKKALRAAKGDRAALHPPVVVPKQ